MVWILSEQFLVRYYEVAHYSTRGKQQSYLMYDRPVIQLQVSRYHCVTLYNNLQPAVVGSPVMRTDAIG